MMATRGCASLTPGYKPRLRLGLTCFACPRIHNHDNIAPRCRDNPAAGVGRIRYVPTGSHERGCLWGGKIKHWVRCLLFGDYSLTLLCVLFACCYWHPNRNDYQTLITYKIKDIIMEAKEKVLATMKQAGEPLNAGKIAELSGLDRKEVDKAMKELKAEGAIVSPVRCKWAPAE